MSDQSAAVELLSSNAVFKRRLSWGRGPLRNGSFWGLCARMMLLGLVACALLGRARAQDEDPLRQEADTTLSRVETTGGDVFLGKIVSETETEIVIATQTQGEITVKQTEIKHREEIDSTRIQEGKYWYRNPHPTRYFFATNAIGLPAGTGYYQNGWFLLTSSVSYGITDHVSVGAGTVPALLPVRLSERGAVPFWVRSELAVSALKETVHFAGGAVFGRGLGIGSSGSGSLYGTATVGGRDHNVTISIGYRYVDSKIKSTPLITLGGMTRISRTLYLISENYVLPAGERTGLVSVGIRWTSETGAVDLALIRPITKFFDRAPPGLWLGIILPFGR